MPALPEQQSYATDLRFCAAVSAGDLWPAARQFSPAPGDVKGNEGENMKTTGKVEDVGTTRDQYFTISWDTTVNWCSYLHARKNKSGPTTGCPPCSPHENKFL